MEDQAKAKEDKMKAEFAEKRKKEEEAAEAKKAEENK